MKNSEKIEKSIPSPVLYKWKRMCYNVAKQEKQPKGGESVAQNRVMSLEKAAVMLPALLQEDTEVPLVVTGSSMTPFLRDGRDTVFLRGIRFQEPRVGDILYFLRRDGVTPILHRIRSINSDGSYVVNGDAQTWTERVEPGQALAVAARVSRDGGEPVSLRRMDKRVMAAVWRWLLPVRPACFRVAGLLHRKQRRE